MTFVVIVLGAYTRLKDAGLGCPDWPGCYGYLTVPAGEEEIQDALERFPDAEFDVSKAWIEVIHRIFAGALGLLIFGMTITNIVRNRRGQEKLSVVLLLTSIVVCFQAILGMLTVTLQLLPLIVTSHLAGGLMTFSLVFLYMLQLYRQDSKASQDKTYAIGKTMKGLAYLGLGLIIAQVLLGGWVSTNYAALACPDFPLCNGELIPPADFATGFDIVHPLGINYEGGVLDDEARVAIHWTHRVGALVLVLFWLGFYAVAKMRKLADRQFEIGVVLGIMAVQIILGITNVLGGLPLMVAVMHNGVAAILLLAGINVVFNLHYGRREPDRYRN